jgi:hypothetical protein
MRSFWKWALVLVIGAFWVAPLLSQERTEPEGTTVKLLLLRQKSVQKELEIAADAAAKIMTFTDGQSEAAGKALEMAPDQRKKAFEQLAEQNKQFLASALNAKQTKRLDQIALQFTAMRELTKPEVAKALGLTDDQQQKLTKLHTEFRKEMAELIEAKDAGDRTEKFAKLREKTRTAALAILTEKQLAQVREVAGPPFMGEIVFETHDAPKKK